MTKSLEAVYAYHRDTKHATTGYAPSPGFLDWDAQPDPFRRFPGAPTLDLPLVKGTGTAPYDSLYGPPCNAAHALNQESLGLFLELALGLSAWKSDGPDRWSMRNNPSSGNLHPTESYLLLWHKACPDMPPGLYHYAPHDHLLERRALLDEALAAQLTQDHPSTFGALAFSTITWREEWKYGSRAFRYCQLDVGHALASSRFAAATLGWTLAYQDSLGDDQLAGLLGLDRREDFAEAEAEYPDALALLGSATRSITIPWDSIAGSLTDWRGTATQASPERVAWPEVARAIKASHKPPTEPHHPPILEPISYQPVATHQDACSLIRNRRSAQRMDGETAMDRSAFERALYRTLATGQSPFDLFPYAPTLNLLIFVHRVAGLDPGLYALIRAPQRFDDFRHASQNKDLSWAHVPDTSLPLYQLDVPGDYRKRASQLSCYQGIAGRGAFSLGMLAPLAEILESEGAWSYRRLHWEAGLIGQVLYLEAEACGLRGTGIGCFFDDDVHGILGLETGEQAPWQTLYHFTVGKALDDRRLTTEPAYSHLSSRPWC